MNSMNSHESNKETKPPRAVFTILPRPNGKPVWRRIGSCFENRDESFNIYLDALPIDGKLHVRIVPAEDQQDDTRQGRGAEPQPTRLPSAFTERQSAPHDDRLQPRGGRRS